jgi:hypothetical protein
VYDNLSSTLTTTQVFRDISAWYHIVVAVDTLQATSSNRTKVYVNGAQVTSFSSAGYPAQGLATRMNGMDVPNQAIGCWIPADGAYHFGGYITEVNVIDGYQLDPSLFGKFDTNNTWVPVPYTGTYGTNGFYLPFTNATTSQTLGYDASLNGTATYDANQDPYRGSVALHLTGNGPAGGNNNVFADSSTNNLAITRGGTATQGSFSPFPLNTNAPYNPATHGASAYFNGSSDYLTVSSFPAIGTQDFTVECWVYANSTATTGGYNPRVFDLVGIQLVIEDSGGRICRLDWNDANSLYTTGSGVFQINQWNHIAVVRISNVVSFYLNGVAQTGGTRSDNLLGGTGYIGVYRGGTLGFFNGYISGFRATIGKGIYTAAFTPTNRPFGTLTNNLITFSEDFSGYGTSQASALAGATIAPDRTPSAFKIVEDTSNSQHGINAAPTVSSGVTYTGSYYIKAAERTQAEIIFFGASATGGNVIGSSFNLISGTVTDSTASATGTIVNVGNGWWRCAVTYTTAGAGVMNVNVFSSTSTTVGGRTYQGNGTSGIFAWGSQLEVASSAGDYTPTPANFSTAPSLLLNFANAAVVDSTGAGNAITYSGATITSASKYGSGAMTYNGTSDWIAVNSGNNASLTPGTKDFTVEYWMNTRTGNDTYRRIVSSNITGFTSGSFVMRHQPGSFLFTPGGGVSGTASYSPDFTLNTWTHIAYSRQGATGRGFINGRQVVTCGDISDYTEAIQYVGAQYTSGNEFFSGSLDDVRITMGVARYTTDFTPPARAYPEIGGKSFVTTNVNAGVVRSFTTTGTTSWTAPSDVTSVEVLVVAAGGTGASDGATNVGNGGGGGGGLIYSNAHPVTPGQTYTVTVGAGQVGLSTGQNRSGGNSQFGNLIAIGGGGGGYYSNGAGSTGGSGGGGGAASGAAGAGTSGQGFAGGAGASNNGGGGGGAGGPASGTNSRDGGLGLKFGISGTPTFYAGGGGGSASSGAQGTGGSGSGGAAVSGGAGGVDGTANTGGGGGAQLAGGTKGGKGGWR